MDPMLEKWIYSGVICFVAGLGIFLYRKEIRFQFRSKIVSGRIVNWMSAVQKGKKLFYPLIEFTPEGGVPIRFRADEHSEGEPMFPQGTEVQVRYLDTDVEFRKIIYPKR
ncbi:MAG: hypothetical protein ACKO6L_07660 [Flavobacteriales bacterium]